MSEHIKIAGLIDTLIGKGRITLWLILVAIASMTFGGFVTGDKALEAIIALSAFALGGEAGSRQPGN
tara:strand:- start:3351 stop:3551 length:201 start_codon:yes stop_codon:yes gene_type:complete